MASKRARRLLQEYLEGTEHPNGDWDARCPLHDDKKRSARINFEKDVWVCFAGCGSGTLTGLLKLMSGLDVARDAPTVGRTASISDKIVQQWHRALLNDPLAQDKLESMKTIKLRTIRKYKIGWDQTRQAFSIPVYLEDGSLFNVRMYRPGESSDRKIFWHRAKDPNVSVPLYPYNILRETDWVLVCAGEIDTLVALQNGFPAVTGTAGESVWTVEWSEQFKDKQVWIVYDRDLTGEKGARLVAEHLEPYASSIRIARIPLKQKGADVADFFWRGKTKSQFKQMLRSASPFQKRSQNPMKMDPINISVMQSFDSQNIGRAQGMDVLISGRARDTYSLPKVVTSRCTMDAGPKCKVCPMLAKRGEKTYEISPSDESLLAMIGSTKLQRNESLRLAARAVKCDRLQHEVKSYQTVEQLYVRPSWDESSGDFTPRRISSVGKHDTMPSQVVHVVGTTWADPHTQKNEFLSWEVAEAENAIDEFRVTPELVRELKQFRPAGRQSPLKKIGLIAKDMEQHVTRIYGRLDLHMAMDLVFMSLIGFPFQGKIERRGWLDALVVGDTRTGKSEVAQRMLEHYGLGQFVNCEAATFAGIIGGLQQMADRQWAVTWGIVPMSDRRLVILDEASGLNPEEIAKMSDVRSRGVIRMQKIQAEQAWARTRLMWLSNPRDESLDKYTYGIQAIQPLIGNREDIARFDFAMALSSRDVGLDDIYQIPSEEEPKYASEDCRRRVLWAWSRKPEDVEWEMGVERDVLTAAEWLGERYVGDPPLIQVANVHVKVARIAVAIASAVFSTDSSGKHVIVKREHVWDATKFLHHLYSKETFGYERMSERHNEMRRRAGRNMDQAKSWLLENRMLIEFLKGVEGQFRRDMLEQMMNVSREEANSIVNTMFAWGLVSPNGYAAKMQPALHSLLRELEEEGL